MGSSGSKNSMTSPPPRRGLVLTVLLAAASVSAQRGGAWSGVRPNPVPPAQDRPVSSTIEKELDELKAEREAVHSIRQSPESSIPESDTATEQREALRRQLLELMQELARRPKPGAKPAAVPAKAPAPLKAADPLPRSIIPQAEPPKPRTGVSIAGTGPVDAMALAQSLFRTGEYVDALTAFRAADRTSSDPRERIMIKYLTAVCLDRIGKKQESLMLFREVANSKDDDVIADCARWQLAVYQWREEAAARIQQLQASGMVLSQPAKGSTAGSNAPGAGGVSVPAGGSTIR